MNRVDFLDLSPMHNSIKNAMTQAFLKVYDSSSFILGAECRKFEESFASFVGTKFCIGVSNGLEALSLILRACDIGEGDEVIVPANTYIATALAVNHVGATPIFVEPNIATYNIDASKIEAKITEKTKAIMIVNLYGSVCEMERILSIAKKHNLKLFEDCAQSHGAEYSVGGRLYCSGSLSDASGFSFYPGKNLGALGDGGAVVTNDKNIADKVFTLRNYGSNIKYYNEIIGYNCRLDELQASFLSIKLSHLNSWTDERRKIAKYYLDNISNKNIVLPKDLGNGSAWHLFVVRAKERSALQNYLSSNGIGTLIHYPVPIHLQKAYEMYGFKKGDFPITEQIANEVLSLPLYVGLTKQDQDYVIETINKF